MVNGVQIAGAFGSGSVSTYGVGGLAADSQVVQAPPDREVVVSAGSWVGVGAGNLQVLAKHINSHGERLDAFVVEAMLDDDAVKPSFDTLKLRILSGDLKFHPSVEPGEGGGDGRGDPDEAQRAADFCKRAHDRLPVPIPVWGWDALDAMAYGNKAAELVLEYVPVGDADGHWSLGALKMKPLWSYHLVTDPFYDLEALYATTPEGPAYIGVDHFVVFSWHPRDGDPRGTSILRAAKDPWRRKLRAKDSRSKGDDQFGSPSLAMELPPNAPLESPGPAGKPIPTTQAAQQEMQAFAGGGCIAFGNGGKLTVVESQRDGVQIGNSIDSYDRAINRAILLSSKATMESKHYTQGGGEIGDDLISTFANFGREWFLAAVRRQVFWRLLAANEGPEYADLYTPRLTIGAMPMDEFMKLATPMAVLGQAGLLYPSWLVNMMRQAGFPAPLPDELRIGPSGAIPDEPIQPAKPAGTTAGATK